MCGLYGFLFKTQALERDPHADAPEGWLKTAKISHLFILSSAVQIYEFSYIHFHIGYSMCPGVRSDS